MNRMRNSFWVMPTLIIVCFVLSSSAYCLENKDIAELKSSLENRGLVEIADKLDRTGQWPQIVSKQARMQLSEEEQRFQQVAGSLAEDLIGKIREFESKHKDVDWNSLEITTDIYAKLGKLLKNKQGYTNLVLAETINNLALLRLGYFLVNNPDRYEEVHSLWSSLERPFYDIGVIANICRAELGDIEAAVQIEKQPGRAAWLFRETFGRKLKDDFPDDPMEMRKTSYLMQNLHGYELQLMRMSGTDILMEITIPGLVEYLRRGGEINDLPAHIRDVRRYNELMSGYERKLKAEFGGIVGPRPSYLNIVSGLKGVRLQDFPAYKILE